MGALQNVPSLTIFNMADNVTLLDLSFNTDGALDGLDALIAKSTELAEKKAQLQKALKEEANQLNEARRAYKEGTASQGEYKDAVDKAAKASIELKKQMLDVKDEIKENNSEIKINKTLLDSQATSVNALRAQLAKNTKEVNAMSAAERENTEAGKNLVAQTKAISDKLKEMEKGVGDNRRNVGNYADSITEAMANTKGLSGATGALTSSMSGGISVIKVFNATLKANPILAIVGFILALISTVEKLMKRNSEMAASLKAAFAPFEVIFSRLLDQITNFLSTVANAIVWVSDAITGLLDKFGLISDATKEAAAQAKALSKAEYDIYEAETNILVPLAEQKRRAEELKTLGADQSRTAKERAEAYKQANEVLKSMEEKEVGLLKQKYEQIKAQNELSYTSQEDARKEAEALAALEEKRAQYATQRKEVISQISGLEKAERDKGVAEAKAAATQVAADKLKAEQKMQQQIKEAQAQAIKQLEQNITSVDLAAREAEIQNNSLKMRIANQQKFNAESEKLEKYKLEQGLIDKQEYNNKVLEMDLELRSLQQEQALAQEEADKQKQAIDFANAQEVRLMGIQNEFDLKQAQLDLAYAQEMEAAERVGADTALVKEKYEKYQQELTRQRINAELTMAGSLAGQLGDLLGEESVAGKAFAVVQATINTYLGATKALAQGGFWGIAQAAAVIAFGMKQVASITKTKDPETKVQTSVKKFAKGGQVYGASHANGGVTFTGSNGQMFEAEGGENVYIMKRTASADIAALSAINEAHGGRSFGTSGMYKFAEGGQVAMISGSNQQTVANQPVVLSSESIAQLASVVIDAVINAPSPVVSVQDIDNGQNNVQVIQNSALL